MAAPRNGRTAGSSGAWAHVVMLGAVFTFASGMVVNKSLLLAISPGEVLAGQLLIGLVCLWAYLILRDGLPRLGRNCWWMILMGLCAPGLVNVANILGMQRTSMVNVVILWSLMPLLIQLLGRLFLHEPLRGRLVLGCIIAFCGVLLILLSRYGKDVGSFQGDLLVACAILASIVTQLLGRRVNQRSDSLTVATMQVTAAAILALAAFPLLHGGGPYFDGWTTKVAIEMVYVGIVSTFLLFLLYNRALSDLPVGRIGLFMTLIPAIGTLGATSYLGEAISATDLMGLAVVMFGVGLPFLIGRLRRGS